MTYKNNSCVLSLRKGERIGLIAPPTLTRGGSEALLSKGLEGLSDSLGGDS